MFDAETLPRSLTIQHARLAALRGLTIQKACPCGAFCLAGVDHLIERYGADLIVSELVPRLRCKKCQRTGWEMAVYLVEGHFREPCGGPPPGWSLALHRMRPEKVPA